MLAFTLVRVSRVNDFCSIYSPFKDTFIVNEVALGRVDDKYEAVNLTLFESDIGMQARCIVYPKVLACCSPLPSPRHVCLVSPFRFVG